MKFPGNRTTCFSYVSLKLLIKGSVDVYIKNNRTYIKFFIFKNIFLRIEKIVNIFLIFEFFFSKIDIIVCP